jgi:D-serine deaminase-like pyridoxal phosphate-dependent protein
MDFAGHSYEEKEAAGIQRVARDEGQQLLDIAALLRADGFDVRHISVGSTPTARYVAAVPGVTEIRPGIYVFSDREQVSLGWGDLDDCALALLMTVVSRPTPTRAIIDGGSKTFSSDTIAHGKGMGAVRQHPEYLVSWLTEEHGILQVPPDAFLPIGSRLEVVPNHACAALNLHDRVYAVRGEYVEDVWPVAARGRVQ